MPKVKMTMNDIPTDLASLDRLLNDKEKITEVASDPGLMARFQFLYARASLMESGDMDQQIEDQTQRVLANLLRDNGAHMNGRLNLAPGAAGPATWAGAHKRSATAPGAKLDGMYRHIGDYFNAIWHRNTTPEKLLQIRNDYSSSIPADGGFLVPEEFRSQLLTLSLESSIVRPRATVLPMRSQRLPVPTIDDTSHATSVFGGIVADWTEEGAEMAETEARFARTVLQAKKLTVYSEAPNELVADAPAFGAFVDQVMPQAVSFYEDLAFLTGSGVGEPLGMLTSTAAVEVAKESGQPADTIVWENIAGMYGRMLPSSLARAVWIASPDTFKELATMALSVGVGGGPVWIGFGEGDQAPPMKILGRPLFFSEKVPKLGDEGDLSFVDFGMYLIGDRQTMTAQSSEHYKFRNDLTAFRIIERADGRPWIQSAITPLNGGATLSPVVKLAERA